MKKQTQMQQVIVALVLLVVGLLVYLLDRPADQIYFVPDWWQPSLSAGQLFGSLGAYLPTFIHVMVFILITSALLAPWHFRIAAICLMWFCIDSLFELAQHDAIAIHIADSVPGWFQDVVFLENTASYFLAGTFDLFDLTSIALGSVTAYLMVRYFWQREVDNVSKQ